MLETIQMNVEKCDTVLKITYTILLKIWTCFTEYQEAIHFFFLSETVLLPLSSQKGIVNIFFLYIQCWNITLKYEDSSLML